MARLRFGKDWSHLGPYTLIIQRRIILHMYANGFLWVPRSCRSADLRSPLTRLISMLLHDAIS